MKYKLLDLWFYIKEMFNCHIRDVHTLSTLHSDGTLHCICEKHVRNLEQMLKEPFKK